MRLEHTCPFCREALPKTKKEREKLNMKRADAKDPVAMYKEGLLQLRNGDDRRASDYFTKAADLGYAWAHYELSIMYDELGSFVEKDGGKSLHYLEEAAIGGHPEARHNLGLHEWNKKGNVEKAVKHWIIAAKQGDDASIKALMKAFRRGECSKDELATALRAHQAAVDATKSPQRDAAEAYYNRTYYYK